MQEATQDEVFAISRTGIAGNEGAEAWFKGSSVQGHDMEEVASIAGESVESEGSSIDGRTR
jgi:hypothetical protein